jgi:hypothetical protein
MYKLRSRPLGQSFQRHRNTPTTFFSLSSPSMDMFTYIIDIFKPTSQADDEDLPTNEENPADGRGMNNFPCVIA